NIAPAFQLHGQYVVTQIKSGFMVIDQQAAHERILYERYLHRLREKKHQTQQQLFPKTIQFSAADTAVLIEILDVVNQLGFDIQTFGKNSFVVHGIPAEFESLHEQQVMEELIEQCKEDRQAMKTSRQDIIAKTFARSNAIKPGQKL